MKTLNQTKKTFFQRITAFVLLNIMLVSIGCYKQGDDSPTISRDQIIQMEIKTAYNNLYIDPEFQTAMSNPAMERIKELESSLDQNMWNIVSGWATLGALDEQLKNGEITDKAQFESYLNESLDAFDTSVNAASSQTTEYIALLKSSGMAQVIEKHYAELMKNYPNPKHPMVQGLKDYFVNGLGADEKNVDDLVNYDVYQSDVKRGYMIRLEEAQANIQASIQEFQTFKAEMLANKDTFFEEKKIDLFIDTPETSSGTRFLGLGSLWNGIKKLAKKVGNVVVQALGAAGNWCLENIVKPIARKLLKIIAKWILNLVEGLTFFRHSVYFIPNVSINTQPGYTPGYGFYVGGGNVSNGYNESGTPNEYPILMVNKQSKGLLSLENDKYFFEKDGQKFLINNPDAIEPWIQITIQKRDNLVPIEGVFDFIINKEQTNQNTHTGYTLIIKRIIRIYQDPHGPSIILTDPKGSDVPFTALVTVRFSEAMDEASINADTFFVSKNGEKVPGTITYFAQINTAVFAPNAPFDKNQLYEVSLTGEIKGDNDKFIKNSLNWSFTTSSSSNLFDQAVFGEARFGY